MQSVFTTPMMKQYFEIKKQYEDCLLFYRMGDFYELFMEDAHIGAQILNITLTSRTKGKDGRIPMAGVPYHAVDSYLTKLVKNGYKVAICEQISLPSKKGLIDREVVRIITPGTLMDEKALGKKENNYIISLTAKDNLLAISIADISTGYFATTEIETNNREQTIKDELARIHPAECILPEEMYNNPDILRILKSENHLNIFPFPEWSIYGDNAKDVLKKHFAVSTLESFNIQDKPLAVQTSAALLGYLQQTQKGPVSHIKKITRLTTNDCVVLDKSTITNLELFTTIREHDSRGTLLHILDHTLTPMGGRLLKNWIKKPLANKEEIELRHEAVNKLLSTEHTKQDIRDNIEQISDIERILSRLSVGLGNGRDLNNLKNSFCTVLKVKKQVTIISNLNEGETVQTEIASQSKKDLLSQIAQNIKPDIQAIISLIETYIVEEPPVSIREGGIIKSHVDTELDKLRKIVNGSREWILELERQERERTGIASLKVRFNQVFGFYIEISKSNLHLVPKEYLRKQTLVNGERFMTPELKKQEEIILTSEEKMNQLEYNFFQGIVTKILEQVMSIQETAQNVAILDCLLNFAFIAEKNNYNRPKMLYSGEIYIKGGRHPVVEKLLEDQQFVPNDVMLDNSSHLQLNGDQPRFNRGQQLLVITGPNMAGKSVFIRQVALIVLMAHIGSYVPADQANIALVDRIFVRSGASDVITSGLSTFMVEMVETANILHQATKNSLIIMDEIGRGTSTYDGISIAWAVAEYLVTHSKPSPKTLFTTHYHELQVLEERYPSEIKNYHMAVVEEKGEPIFLHTILPGGASHSFGVAVAKLAGIPEEVITRANELLVELEKRADNNLIQNKHTLPPQINLSDHLIQKELESIDIHQMTPLEALNTLAELKAKLKLFELKSKKMMEMD